MAQALVLVCLLATLGSTMAGGDRNQGSVVQKVIEMLQDNKVKIAEDLKAEELEMAAYSQFCDDEVTQKGYAIKTAERSLLDLDATVADCRAQARAAADEIASLGSLMATKDRELAAANDVRSKERADFEATEKALSGSVDQLEKAVVLMKRSGAALLQGPAKSRMDMARALNKLLGKVIEAAWVDRGSSKTLKGFLQQQDGSESEDAENMRLLKGQQSPDAAVSSGGILAALEDMKEKAAETLSGARAGEMKAAHNHQMMVQSLTTALEHAKQRLSDQKSLEATVTQDSSKAQGESALVQKTKIADKVYLDQTKRACAEAAKTWEERQASASGELAAIEKAKSILSERVQVFFVQTAKDIPAEGEDDKTVAERSALVNKLKALGHQLNSFALMELAGTAASDPFEKVRSLIGDMVKRLESEANAEASQKSFCDEENKKSRAEQEEKSMRSDELRSRQDSATAAQAELQEQVKTLQEELAQIDQSSAEATQIRSNEHATYLKSSADFKGAAQAVQQAIHVLKEYYAGAASLIQKAKQPSFGGSKSDAAGSIIAILETSGENFSKMYVEVETVEAAAVAAFKRSAEETKVQKASKEAEVRGAESEIKSLAVALQNGGEDLNMATKELDAVMSYLDKLKPQCEQKAMTYDEKKAHRDAEIEGLKEALQLLDAPALLQLRGTNRH